MGVPEIGTKNQNSQQRAPAPWAGRELYFQEQSWLQQNQIVLLNFCLSQNEDGTWKFFGNKKITLTWMGCGHQLYNIIVSLMLVFLPLTRKEY